MDTDSIMLSLDKIFPTKDADLDEVVELADAVGEITNQGFAEFCKFAFNAPDDRLGVIKTEREVVSDKSLFLSKKRYILSVVDDEGKRVDKLKIQGVELKKSDTSTATKKYLLELVNMILDDKSMEDVLRRVNEMKGEFREESLFDIAVPCNTKTLSKINKTYELTGSLKGAHYSAKAAFMWNKTKTNQDQEVYAGQKIGLLYVKHPNFSCIGYPIDLQTLPDWFLEIPVDYDKMWEKCYKKLTNYLTSVGWDIKSRRDAVVNDLFGF
jgi:DNA polymerase elongation subunit (family B)